LAHHFTEAGLHEQAVVYWYKAGQLASERSAHREAIAHLTKGLELLKTLPDTSERHQFELDILTLQGSALVATQGPASRAVEQNYAQALELCRQLGETSQHFLILWGLWEFHAVRAAYPTSQELGDQLLALSRSTQDPALSLAACRALGTTLFYLGELPLARSYVEQGIDLYERQQHDVMAVLHGQDLGVSCFTYGALTLLWLGYPDQAFQHIHKALALAQEQSHPYTLARTLNFVAMFHHCRREGQTVQERAEAALSLATAQSFPFWLAWARIQWGWALADQGKNVEGLPQIRQGLAAYQATGAEVQWPYLLTMLAEAHWRAEQAEDGSRVLTEALAVMDKTGERFYAAEIHRLRGEILLQLSSDNATEAETCFKQAITIAQNQSAKSWELRAATSLARLWRSQGKRDEARELLEPVYSWFTEGFDTADLRDAKALLDELA
jgi:predicted ATPase